MRILLFSGALGLILGACNNDKTDTAGGDTDADTDTDTDTDTDADTDADTDTDTDADLTALRVELDGATSLSTRDTVGFTVFADYDDGSAVDVTDLANLGSTDEAVLTIYQVGVGQPLDGGSAQLTASYDTLDATSDALTITVSPAAAGDLVFNELLADATVDGDPNGDGTPDSTEDEFVEIANIADVTVDLSGVTLVEESMPDLPRHTFAEGTVLRAGEAIVVFGGGDVSSLSAAHASFTIAENDDPGIQYGLSLSDNGDTVTLKATDDSTITALAYGSSGDGTVSTVSDASIVLNPDVWGSSYADHSGVSGAVGAYSPGTWTDGSDFEGPDARYSARR